MSLTEEQVKPHNLVAGSFFDVCELLPAIMCLNESSIRYQNRVHSPTVGHHKLSSPYTAHTPPLAHN